MTPDFAVRSAEAELMDDPSVGEAELGRTLSELEFINRTLGGYAASLSALERLLPPDRRAFTVLDAGCGGGDVARRIVDWAARRGLEARVHGVDLSEAAVRLASARAVPGLSFAAGDLFALPQARPYDVVHAALLLHHCPGEEAVRALAKLFSLCRLGLVVNDLHRHPAAYHAIRVLTAAFSRDRLIRHDAPLSVLRAFRRECLEDLCRRARLPAPEIRWHWAFRWSMVVRR